MARKTVRNSTLHGLFILMALIGVLQVLNLYSTSRGHDSFPSEILVSPLPLIDRTTHRVHVHVPEPPIKNGHPAILLHQQPPEPSELLRRKLAVYRNMMRTNQYAAKVTLDYSVLTADTDLFYKQTATLPPIKNGHPAILIHQPPPEPSELLRRKLAVYRNMMRKNQSAAKVTLDYSVLNADTDLFYKQTGNRVPLRETAVRFFKPFYNPLVHGVENDNEGYLTFGISTVQRPNTDKIYIFETLDSLIQHVSPADLPFIHVVVSLSDPNMTYNHHLSDLLVKRYTKYVDSGFLRIIQPPKDIYPDFDTVKQTYNDPITRVKWRAKQNIDFAYLCLYSRNISRYYIQIEDDVITSKDMIRDIQSFVASRKVPWFLLEFSYLGYIGKLFHSEDLAYVANFLLTYFDKMPCDLLLGNMRAMKGQVKPIHSAFGLFQHIGKFSSLANKLMPSLDERFKDAGKVDLSANHLPQGTNPPITIDTNFIGVKGSNPLDAYNNNITTYYWVTSPSANTYMRLMFRQSFNFTRVIITTGDANKKHDSLKSGALHFSVGKLDPESGKYKCVKFELLANFVGGEVDTQAMGVKMPLNIRCLKIMVLRKTRNWVKFRNIIVV